MNIRFSIFLVAILALIGGFVYFTQFNKPREPAEDRPLFYKVNSEDIVRISVQHEGSGVSFKKMGEGEWVFDNPEQTPVNRERFQGTTVLLSGPRAERLFAEQISDPTVYGLGPPRSTIEVFLNTGQAFRLELGDKNPTGDRVYARLGGDPRLFQITSSWSDVLIRLVTEPPTPTPEPEEPEPSTG